jgi:DNA mismatch endonuclease, patch repair protein
VAGLTRSEQMARIRGRDTSPEVLLRKALWARGIRYRINFKTVGGRADIAIPAKRIVIFIDGCFWHGCPDHYVLPRSNRGFWAQKLRENVSRDRRQVLALDAAGWSVIRVWEHEIQDSCEMLAAQLVGDHSWLRRRACWRVVEVKSDAVDAGFELRRLEGLRDPARQKMHRSRRTTRKTGRIKRRLIR